MPHGKPIVGVHKPAGTGPFPAVLFHKTAEMALGFESNVVKKRPEYGENGFKMAKISKYSRNGVKTESKCGKNRSKWSKTGFKWLKIGQRRVK